MLGRWWDTLRMLYKYGYRSPTTTTALVKSLVSSFVTLYSTTTSWSSVEDVSNQLNFTGLTVQDTAGYLASQGVGADFAFEIVESATRVNYGQDLDKIHAVEGLVSMAANGAAGAKGGNYQVFANFLQSSKAKVHLGRTVTQLTKDVSDAEGTWLVETGSKSAAKHYDSVILAAPHHTTGIRFPKSTAEVPVSPYVHLHVTLLSTTSPSYNPAYFNLPEGSVLPSMILTTAQGIRAGGPVPDFNSINYLTRIEAGRDEWAVKIFSKTKIEDAWIENMFGKDKVGWVLRHEVNVLTRT